MIVTRFAPSPTGRLHLGHAYSAVRGHALAQQSGGRWLLRIEDLDQTRSRAEFIDAIAQDLRWLGLDWAEPVLVQSQRDVRYNEALRRLRDQGLIYACFCSRRDIAAALAAPHAPAAHYRGTCRRLPDDPVRRAQQPHSWRLDAQKALAAAGLPSWTERGQELSAPPEAFDDIILARKDAPAAYHLACVVDDAESGVTVVVRGVDLRPSTPVQRLLQQLLGLAEPDYLHHPLVMHGDGLRLAKRNIAPTLAAMREAGVDGGVLARELSADRVPAGFRLQDA